MKRHPPETTRTCPHLHATTLFRTADRAGRDGQRLQEAGRLRPGSAQQPPPHRAATGAAIMSRSGAVKQSPPTTGRLHEAFGHLFRRCHLRSQQAFARVFDGYGLSPLQYGILELVLLNPGIGHGALAEAMATAPSVVTTAMKPLRAAGHVVLEETPGEIGRAHA